ncbi:MAG: hypothetical protein LBO05_03755 [Deltaproteobacteria bacterium]|nr:hypothetical protein [Deltaproteobacteria bacterium]
MELRRNKETVQTAKHAVGLDKEERDALDAVVKDTAGPARPVPAAEVPPRSDTGARGQVMRTRMRIGRGLKTSRFAAGNIIRRPREDGPAAAPAQKPRSVRPNRNKFDEEFQEKPAKPAASPPPAGETRRTLFLLTDRINMTGPARGGGSMRGVRSRLKKMNLALGGEKTGRPPAATRTRTPPPDTDTDDGGHDGGGDDI